MLNAAEPAPHHVVDVAELQRLSLLAQLGVLDTDPEPAFDALTHAAAVLTDCPIALISLVDGERQWFKARVGMDATQTPREWSFCSVAIRSPDLLEVRDAKADPRFADNPLVTGTPGVRFYAGQPLTVDGVRIGTLCVIDTRARELDRRGREALQDLGVAAAAMLSERRHRVASSEQQQRLTEFAMVAGDWLWETDTEHRIVWMSPAYANRPVPPEPWVLGQQMADGPVVDVPTTVPSAPATLHGLFEQRLGFARALVRSDAGATTRYLSHSAVCRLDSAGRWNGYRGITHDMSERVAAEQTHRQAAALLADLSAQVPGVIYQCRLEPNGSFNVPYVSERIRAVCELSVDEVKADAKSAAQRCHPQDRERVLSSMLLSASNLAPWCETFRAVLPSGGERMLCGNAEPKRLDDGAVLWHGLLTDVTEQVKAAAQLQALTLAQAGAERAAQVRSEFMSRVSHELRTPLNAILGFAQLLRLNGVAQRAEDTLAWAAHIETAGEHLLSLVNDMLDLSSLNAGRLKLQLEPVAVLPLVQHVLALLAPVAREAGVTLQMHADAALPTILADARAVKQVLFNLLGNAIKFTRAASVVSVHLRCAPQAKQLTLSVTDAGPGIDAAHLASLFEPFKRLQSGSAAPAGTGLGLSISHKLVAAMGGTIDVVSEPGRGTTFTVHWLVDGRPATLPAANGAELGAPPVLATRLLGADTVLYIEDDAVNVILMQALFETFATQPPSLLIATDGGDGLRQAMRHRPNLIMLDMNLPDMSGLTVLSRLRADPRTASIPVIAVSADALPEQVRLAREAGCVDYWTKPVVFKRIGAELARRFPAAA